MSDDTFVVSCDHCHTKLKVRATAKKVKCSKCQNVVDCQSTGSSAPQPAEARKRAERNVSPTLPTASVPTETAKPLGFFGYCWHSYADTHTVLPWFVGGILGIIAIPSISFVKPFIGIKSIWYAFGMTGLLAISLFTILLMLACMKYLFANQRHIPEGHTTWLSAMTCFLLYISPALGIVAAAETFGPDSGILVAVVPQLQKEQARFASFPSVKQSETESVASDSDNVKVAASVIPNSTAEPEQASQTVPPQQNSRESQTEIAQTKESPLPDSKPDRPRLSKSSASNSKEPNQEVIAEGVGATADEAIKDAFRNAVRQVVGAVVDAETLIKNDEVIDDKVLTYSAAFIKTYDELPGSKKVKDGLHRIKINAQVERRSVIAKLTAANVAVKAVDGKGLFAEVVTQLDAEKDASAILKKQFEGFPQSCITAKIVGTPEVVEKTAEKATVKIIVQIEPDLNAYKAFSSRLTPVLEKLAKSKREITETFTWEDNYKFFFVQPRVNSPDQLQRCLKKGQITIAVTTLRTKAGDSIDYSVFEIDPVLQPLLAALASRKGQGKLQLLTAEGDTIVTKRFDLGFTSPKHNNIECAGTLVSSFGLVWGTELNELDLSRGGNWGKNEAGLIIITPTFMQSRTNRLCHIPQGSIPCTFTLTLDELKSVKDAKVEITFDE